MPTSINVIGMCRTMPRVEYAAGNAVKSSTTTTINQTWFASQIGAMELAINSRCSTRRGPLANRSQTPPPKSAPPMSAYAFSASTMMPATISGRPIDDRNVLTPSPEPWR
jgi:hypothetical protein